MFKNLFTSLFALSLSFTGCFIAPTVPVRAEANTPPTVLTTPYEVCEYFNSKFTNHDCTGVPNIPGTTLVTDGLYRIEPDVNVVLKDMNITYTSIRGIFSLMGGKITIDGGTYTTAGSCLINVSYNSYTGESNANNLQIISGDFVAERSVKRYSQTPICLNYPANPGEGLSQTLFRSILGPNSYYTEFDTLTEIPLETNLAIGVENFDKNYSNVDEITYINRTKFSVRERTPEPESTSETTPTPEPTTEQPTIVIPKAPNTGVAK